MKCEDVQNLQGPYLDSELDAKTSLDIQEHLRGCPECARLYSQEEVLQAWIKASLNRGQLSPPLWERLERSLKEAARSKVTSEVSGRSQPAGAGVTRAGFLARLRGAWPNSRLLWAGLATAWLVILTLNTTYRDAGATSVARHEALNASEVRFAMNQKRGLLTELTLPSEPASALKTKPHPVSPRSDRARNTLNS